MRIRTIMIPVRGDGKGEQSMNHSIVLARKFGAHLDVFHARPKAEDLNTFGFTAPSRGFIRDEVIKAAEDGADLEEKRVRELFEAYCKGHDLKMTDSPDVASDDVTASWHVEVGHHQRDVIGLRGRLTDLICVAQPEGRLGQKTLEGALFETGQPVMVAPPGEPKSVGDNIAVAWNGSAEAARAVTSAISIFEKAKRVVIFSAPVTTEERLSPEQLQRYLKWHGVEVEVREFEAASHAIGEGLLSGAKGMEADLLVMGAYGQVYRRQLMLGGVTEYIIKNSKIPILLHH